MFSWSNNNNNDAHGVRMRSALMHQKLVVFSVYLKIICTLNKMSANVYPNGPKSAENGVRE